MTEPTPEARALPSPGVTGLPERPAEHEARVVSRAHVLRLQQRVVEVAIPFWGAALQAAPPAVEAAAEEFFALYPERPILDNSGGSGYADCFWIYTAVRLLAAELIVESGVYKGQTSWLFRRACPRARLYAVDVDLGLRRYRDASIRYHEGDWTETSVGDVDPTASVCFFDDHVNQARRVREAYERGFRTLLFDDDLPAETLYATGGPPVPTIAMLFDQALEPGERIEWMRHGRRHQYVFNPADTFGARDLVASRHMTPNLTPIVRQRPQGGLTLVRLRD